MKKLLAMALSLSLLAGLCVPVVAQAPEAPGKDARLAAVTGTVKKTLGVDTEVYTEFFGDVEENVLAPTWRLHWGGKGMSLEVTASETGKVLSYSRNDREDSAPYRPEQLLPTFPTGNRQEAQKAAQAFLDKVLEKNETAQFTQEEFGSLSAENHQFYADILLNGLPSPFSLRITVRGADNQVLRFHRDDLNGRYMGGVPGKTTAVTADQASKLLRDTLSLKLEYVTGEDETAAVLRYLPQMTDRFYVDGETGKLVNLTELYGKVGETGGRGDGNMEFDTATPAATPNPGADKLTEAEQAGVAQMEGVLTKEALSAAVQKAYPQLGLQKYTLAGASYRVAREEDLKEKTNLPEVSCELVFSRKTGDGVARRTVNVDARTAQLQSVYSALPWSETGKYPVSPAKAQKNAEAFLQAHFPENFAKSALYSGDEKLDKYSTSCFFIFAQQEQKIFFPENSYSISVDAADGTIASFHQDFDRKVTFQSPQGILSMDQAVDAFLKSFQLPLAYVAVPTSVDYAGSDLRPLLQEAGYQYLYALKLGYGLTADQSVAGIDAKTGEIIPMDWGQKEEALAYDDLEGSWAKTQIEELANYGIGYTTGSFQPGKALNQLDLLVLLVSSRGYRYDPAEQDATDHLYDYAYGMGLLDRGSRDETAPVTRLALVKLLLDGGGYEKVAALPGIYRCDFTDAQEIGAADLGYAALAQGLGLVKGDGKGAFAPGRTATRAEGAVLLHHFMEIL